LQTSGVFRILSRKKRFLWRFHLLTSGFFRSYLLSFTVHQIVHSSSTFTAETAMQDYSKLDRPEILRHIFFPQKIRKTDSSKTVHDISIEVAEGISLGCRFYESSKEAPTLLYFHGNGETVADYDMIAPSFCSNGMNIFISTYRGYGWSNGSPSVTSMFSDAEKVCARAMDWLKQRDFAGPLFVMGRSLGSACAIDVALQHGTGIRGLIIESGFADTLPLAQSLGLNSFGSDILTEEDGFKNREKIAQIKLPTFIIHGARDQLIPADQAEGLQMSSGARNKEFVLVPGADHNSVIAVAGERYFQSIKKFIDGVCGINTWRQARKKFKEDKRNQAK